MLEVKVKMDGAHRSVDYIVNGVVIDNHHNGSLSDLYSHAIAYVTRTLGSSENVSHIVKVTSEDGAIDIPQAEAKPEKMTAEQKEYISFKKQMRMLGSHFDVSVYFPDSYPPKVTDSQHH